MNFQSKKGFTLVELAIVMIIIGLLIGGILKGTEMIENAKVSSTLSQMKAYQAAVYTFMDTYSAMPGDMRNASERVPGCTNATNCPAAGAGAGNGDSLVSDGGNGHTTVVWSSDITTWNESFLFWKHLVLADLITGVTTDADIANLAWGESHPAAKVGGGFEFFYDSAMASGGGGGGADTSFSAHMLRMSNGGVTGTVGGQGTSVVSPLRGFQMDRKVDDGDPNSGSVLATYGNEVAAGCKDADGYLAQERRKSCTMYFVFDR